MAGFLFCGAIFDARQAKFWSDGFHGGNAEGDVLFEIEAQIGGSFDDVLAMHAAGKGFVFHLFSYRWSFDLGQRFAWLDKCAGGVESGEFVAGEESFFHGRDAWNTAVLGVGEDGAANFFWVSALLQNLAAFEGMVFKARIFFVVEVVEKSDSPPKFFIGLSFAGIGPHANFNGERVLEQAFGLGEFGQELPVWVLAGWHCLVFSDYYRRDSL